MFKFIVTIQDAYGRITTRTLEMGATAYIDAAADSAAFLADLQAATKCAVVQTQLTEVTSIVATPTAGSNVDAGATLVFDLGGLKKAIWKLPDPVSGIVQSDGTVVLSDTNIVNLVDNFTSGNVLISDGETALSLLRGTLDK